MDEQNAFCEVRCHSRPLKAFLLHFSRTLTPVFKIFIRQYAEFTKCRQTSFSGKFRKTQKFLDWISTRHGENVGPKLKVSTYDILVYLAKETIAELLDLVFLLRKDKMSFPSDPYSRAYVSSVQSTSRQALDANSKVRFSRIYVAGTNLCLILFVNNTG